MQEKSLPNERFLVLFFLVCSGVAHNRSFETAAAEDSNALAAVDSSPFFHTVAIAALLVEKHKWRRSIYPSATAAELLVMMEEVKSGHHHHKNLLLLQSSILAETRDDAVLCVVFLPASQYMPQMYPSPFTNIRLLLT